MNAGHDAASVKNPPVRSSNHNTFYEVFSFCANNFNDGIMWSSIFLAMMLIYV